MDFQAMMESFAEAWVAANANSANISSTNNIEATNNASLENNMLLPASTSVPVSLEAALNASHDALARRVTEGLAAVAAASSVSGNNNNNNNNTNNSNNSAGNNNSNGPSNNSSSNGNNTNANSSTSGNTSNNSLNSGNNLLANPFLGLSDLVSSESVAASDLVSPFAANLLELKDAITGPNARNTIPIHCIIERANPPLSSPKESGQISNSGQSLPNLLSPNSSNKSSSNDNNNENDTSSANQSKLNNNSNNNNSSNSNNSNNNCSSNNNGNNSANNNGTSTSNDNINNNNGSSSNNNSSGNGNNSNSNQNFSDSGSTFSGNVVVEQDTYAMLCANLPFVDIMRATLTKLGYAPQEMIGAKAFVQLRNWKALAVEQICDQAESSIADIISDISSFITLRIRLFRPKMSAAHELKDKILQVLLAHSYTLLANNAAQVAAAAAAATTGSPPSTTPTVAPTVSPPNASLNAAPALDQLLSQLLRSGRNDSLSVPPPPLQALITPTEEEARRRLDQFYLQQMLGQYRQFALAAVNQQQQQTAQQQQQQQAAAVAQLNALRPAASGSPTLSGANPLASPLFLDLNSLANGHDATLAAAAASLHPSIAAAAAAAAAARSLPNGGGLSGPSPGSLEAKFGLKGLGGNGTGNNTSLASSRTRIRTSFDPELELPKLHKWFQENRHPTRSQVQDYVRELNQLESRKGRKPLDVNNVVYWFKNARAAHKRAELKFISGGDSVSVPVSGSNSYGFGPDFFNNGQHSPSKSSEASKNDDIERRNGSNMDDYYSYDDEDGDSHEMETLDLSLARHGSMMHCKSPASNLEIKLEIDEDQNEDSFAKEMNKDSGEQNDMMDTEQHSPNSDNNSGDDDSDDDVDQTALNVVAAAAHLQLNSPISRAANLAHLMAQSNQHLNSLTAPGGPLHHGNNNCSNNSNANHHHHHSSQMSQNSSASSQPDSPDAKRARRSRTFIDPMTEVPKLESWFVLNSHPAQSQIARYTEELNQMNYRQKFPKLEPKNIQFWFKNRRAKIKRTGMSPVATLAGLQAAITSANSPSTTTNSTAAAAAAALALNSSALNIERLINAH